MVVQILVATARIAEAGAPIWGVRKRIKKPSLGPIPAGAKTIAYPNTYEAPNADIKGNNPPVSPKL
jgi:hypothetical protein